MPPRLLRRRDHHARYWGRRATTHTPPARATGKGHKGAIITMPPWSPFSAALSSPRRETMGEGRSIRSTLRRVSRPNLPSVFNPVPISRSSVWLLAPHRFYSFRTTSAEHSNPFQQLSFLAKTRRHSLRTSNRPCHASPTQRVALRQHFATPRRGSFVAPRAAAIHWGLNKIRRRGKDCLLPVRSSTDSHRAESSPLLTASLVFRDRLSVSNPSV